MISLLPPELIALILSFASPLPSLLLPSTSLPRQTLLSTSLVSTLFASFSQSLLFNSPILDQSGQIKAFAKVVHHNQDLAARVRNVVVEAKEGQELLRKPDPNLKIILRACQRLEELVVVQMAVPLDALRHSQLRKLTLWGIHLSLIAQSAPPHLAHLTHLSIVSSQTPSHALSRLLSPHVLPSLSHLALHNLSTGGTHDTKLPFALPALVRDGQLAFLSIDMDLAAFLELDLSPFPSSPLSLSSLSLSPPPPPSLPPKILFDATSTAPSSLPTSLSTFASQISHRITHLSYHSLKAVDMVQIKRVLPNLEVVFVETREGEESWKVGCENLGVRVVGGLRGGDGGEMEERKSGIREDWLLEVGGA